MKEVSPISQLLIRPVIPSPEKLLAAALVRLGYPGAEAVGEKVMPHLERETERCLSLADPRAMCRMTPFIRSEKDSIEGDGLIVQSVNWTRLTRRMQDVRYLCCLAVTLGGRVDEAIRESGRNQLTASFILDAVGSALVELLAEEGQSQIHEYFQELGLKAGNRFSPGYCDWSMKSGQAELGGFLQPQTIGVDIMPATGLMTPRKSITAVIIAATDMPDLTPCFLCARECEHRRAPFVAAPR